MNESRDAACETCGHIHASATGCESSEAAWSISELEVKEERSRHYSELRPVLFTQMDGGEFPEEWVSSCATFELMTGLPDVRVLITEGTEHEVALRLLRKLRKWLKACPNCLSSRCPGRSAPTIVMTPSRSKPTAEDDVFVNLERDDLVSLALRAALSVGEREVSETPCVARLS